MGDIVKLALRLFIFALVASVLLAVTNEVTKGPIEQQKLASKMAALNTVLPGCEYEQIEYEGISDDSALDEIFVGKNADGSIKGYALTANPQGYGGEIPITLGVSEGGYVTQVYVGSLQETQGLGSRVGDDAFKEQFIAIAADPDTLRNDVDTIAGATISSSAFVNAVQEMLTYTKGTLGIEPHAGDKDAILAEAAAINGGDEGEDAPVETTTNTYDVTGFAAFKVDVTVDSNGKIVSVSVPENNETPGFGADLIADQSVFDALAGQDIATAQIDVKSGVTLTSNAINDALKQAASAGESGEGSAKVYDVTGFAPFKVEIALDDAGKIVSVSVPENNETPGLGADLIADQSVFDALVGQDIATAQIDVKSGVTLTSNAINDALKQAAADLGGAEAAPAVAGDPYTVKGMNKFTLYVEVKDGGKIASVSAPNNSETPGFGADMLTDEALSALVGEDLATAHVDVKSGVTLTSDAINAALKQAAIANGVAVAAEPTVEATAEPTAEPAVVPTVAENAAVELTMYDVTGFAPFKVGIAVDENGKIVSVSVPENSETPGLGADLIADQSIFDALVGQDIATAQIDVKSGVTLTSDAINAALKQAAIANGVTVVAEPTVEATAEPAAEPTVTENAVVEPTVAENAAVEPTMYDVTGFAPFKVEIAVDGNGKIVSVTVPENSETPGLGADLIADQSIFDALVGQDIATAQIDVKSGVTLTSNAINDALRQAAAQFGGEATRDESAADGVAIGTYDVTGFAPFKVEIAVDGNGKIVSVSVPENNETPGLGADLIADQSIFDALVGQDIATAQIDVKSGVTLTSNAINDALRQAAAQFGGEATRDESAADGVAIGTYDVTGFAPFKVEIAVDGNGKIVSVSVPENNETPGLGADLIADQSIFDALAGQDIATAKIDVKSGVTLTSNAINDALGQAAKEVQ